MQHFELKVTSKGQVTLPSEYRKALGIETGTTLSLTLDEHGQSILKKRLSVEEAMGSLRHLGSKLGRRMVQEDIDDAITAAMSEQERRIRGRRAR
jgi:AbrB family looped-hinge helix DNA binding protein